jgi:N-acyl amino acid synthase of PEP-CTERM/exosortase system
VSGMEDFQFKKVEIHDQEMMDQIFRLRFQVYARECGFIKEADYPGQKESDEYDKEQSVHFAALDSAGAVIGTMRLLLPGALPLPIERHCPSLKITPDPVNGHAEVSRLVISKQLRRRRDDGLYYEPQVEDKTVTGEHAEFLRRAKPMAFGLYREMYQESKRRGLVYWYALMEKSLWLLLRIHGFRFDCIGEEVDVYGAVCPYLGKLPVIEQEVLRKFPKFFDFFNENLNQKTMAEE